MKVVKSLPLLLFQCLRVSIFLFIFDASTSGLGPMPTKAFYRPSHAFTLSGAWAETLENDFGLVSNGTMSLAYRVQSNLTVFYESTYLLFIVVDTPQKEGWYQGLASGPLTQDEARAYCSRPAAFRMHAQEARYSPATSSSPSTWTSAMMVAEEVEAGRQGEGGFTFVASSTSRYSAYMLQCIPSTWDSAANSSAAQDLVVELEYYMANPLPDAAMPASLHSNSQFDYAYSDSGYLATVDSYSYLPIQNVTSPGVAAILVALYTAMLAALLVTSALRYSYLPSRWRKRFFPLYAATLSMGLAARATEFAVLDELDSIGEADVGTQLMSAVFSSAERAIFAFVCLLLASASGGAAQEGGMFRSAMSRGSRRELGSVLALALLMLVLLVVELHCRFVFSNTTMLSSSENGMYSLQNRVPSEPGGPDGEVSPAVCRSGGVVLFLVRAVMALATLLGINYGITNTRNTLWSTPDARTSHASTASQYLSLSRLLWLRYLYVAYLIMPTVWLAIKLGVVSWRSEWLLSGGSVGNSSSSSQPSLLPALFDLYIYYALYLVLFGPSDAEAKLTAAFMRPQEAPAEPAPRE